MTIVGLTGGIATGKSAVADMFAELGAQVYSADADARAVLAPNSPALPRVLDLFPDARGAGDALDRARLAAIMFGDAEARRRLEALTHPLIIARMKSVIEQARGQNRDGVLVYETPLLYEANLQNLFDVVVATFAPPSVQAERLQERERKAGRAPLTDAAITDRLAAQLPGEEKARRAGFVIRTGVTLDETRARVSEVWNELTSGNL